MKGGSMDFTTLSDEQDMLRDTARRALAEAVDKNALRAGAAADPAFVARTWSLAATMGWTGMLVPLAAGGLGLGFADAAVLCTEFGRALFPGPFAATAILTATLAGMQVAPGWRDGVLPAIATGRMRVATIGIEQLVETTATPQPGSRDSAERPDIVEYPHSATHFLSIARDGSTCRALLFPADAAGVSLTMWQPFDVTCPVGAVEFPGLDAAILRCDISQAQTAELLAASRIAAAAELVGVADAALDKAVAYSRERQQFGVPIGSFQAIKHRLADGFVLLENARTATRHAAAAQDARADDRSIAIDVARSCAVEAALRITADCIQVHGALGFSWEHDAHLYLKRARRIVGTLGDAHSARRSIGDLLAQVVQSGAGTLFPPIGPVQPAII
jgi:alkylation response protein AidB-like acyl-CoA dehydrogenase